MSAQSPEQRLSRLLFLRRRIDLEIAALASQTGRKIRPKGAAPCGTETAYQRHRKAGETADDLCKAGHNLYVKAQQQRAREVGWAS